MKIKRLNLKSEKWQKLNKKTRRRIIGAGILIVAIVGVNVITSSIRGAQTARQDSSKETEKVTVRDLVTSVSATGTFYSDMSTDESVDLSNIKVTKVNVEVGDVVNVGDLICSFDISDIEESVTTTQKSLDTTKAQNDLSITSAQRQLNSAKKAQTENKATVNRNNESAKRTYNDAKTSVFDAKKELSDAKDKVKTTKETVSTTKKAYEDSKKSSDKAQKTYREKQEKLTKAKSERDTVQQKHDTLFAAGNVAHTEKDVTACASCQASYNAKVLAVTNAQTACDAAEADYNGKNATTVTASSTYTTARTEYESAKTAVKTAENAVETAQQQADSAYSTYESTVAQGNTTKRTDNDTIKSQEDSVENAKLTAESSTITTEQQLKDYQEQLELGNLTAKQRGVITAVNVTEGGTYAGGNVVTIQDDSVLLIEAEIDEYDVADLSVGMEVLIKTDATREEALTGTISRISPVATSSSSASSALTGNTTSSVSGTTATSTSGGTYTVKIALDQQNERLRLGMTAKLSIITNQKKGVLTVPYNAVQEDENNKFHVSVLKEDGTTEDINVTVGMESDYYTEVSGEGIKEGLSVVLQTEGSTSVESLFSGRSGGMGGF